MQTMTPKCRHHYEGKDPPIDFIILHILLIANIFAIITPEDQYEINEQQDDTIYCYISK